METRCNVRTDLALEARESIQEADSRLRGVEVEETELKDIEVKVTRVRILTKNAAREMGKPIGNYITLEAPGMLEADEDYHREISNQIAKQLLELFPTEQFPNKSASVLVVGLGNRDVTADALGPDVVDNLFVTRHVIREYGKAAYENSDIYMISCIVPGVMAKTGMETAEIIKGVIEETKPDVVIVVDALAARSVRRLNRTIQITDTGIHPGSGVGNHRNALTKESLGIPVIAIGIPTVVDAATIVRDAMGENCLTPDSRITTELNNMYVTCKDIDAIVKRLSFMVSEALNIAFA